MTSIPPSLLDRLRAWPASREASRRPAAWAADDLLSPFPRAAEAVAASRTDPSVLAALAARADDETTALAAVSALVPGLGRIAGRWMRAGLAGADFQDAEAQLVLETLEALRVAPARTPDAIVQQAWHRVSARRQTELARRSRCLPLRDLDLSAPDEYSPTSWTIRAVVGADLTDTDRRTVLAAITGAKRADGSVTPGAERTRRWRARRALRAALLEDGNQSLRPEAV